jgi:hypothetical protein
MNTCAGSRYCTRDPEASPFFALVRDYFDEFERVYPEQFHKHHGYWWPVMHNSIDKFLKYADVSVFEKCQQTVRQKILKHCGMWKESVQRPPPQKISAVIEKPSLDFEFFDGICI